MFKSSSVISAVMVLAKYAKPLVDSELTSYEVDSLLKQIESVSANYIIAFDENNEEKALVSLPSLSVMLKDKKRNYRHNVETITVTGNGVVYDRYTKQLDGKWLNIRNVFSKNTSIEYAAIEDLPNPSAVFEAIKQLGITIHFDTSSSLAKAS